MVKGKAQRDGSTWKLDSGWTHEVRAHMQMQNRMALSRRRGCFYPFTCRAEMATMACHNEVNKLLETVDETVYELLAKPFLVLGITPSQVQNFQPTEKARRRRSESTRILR